MPGKILIIDDDLDISTLISVLLKREGYEAITADAASFFSSLPLINPNLILMDNRLGDEFGKDYCRALKQDPATRHYKIVFVSGADDLETIARENLADACIQKPFDLAYLLHTVRRLVPAS